MPRIRLFLALFCLFFSFLALTSLVSDEATFKKVTTATVADEKSGPLLLTGNSITTILPQGLALNEEELATLPSEQFIVAAWRESADAIHGQLQEIGSGEKVSLDLTPFLLAVMSELGFPEREATRQIISFPGEPFSQIYQLIEIATPILSLALFLSLALPWYRTRNDVLPLLLFFSITLLSLSLLFCFSSLTLLLLKNINPSLPIIFFEKGLWLLAKNVFLLSLPLLLMNWLNKGWHLFLPLSALISFLLFPLSIALPLSAFLLLLVISLFKANPPVKKASQASAS